MINKKELVRTTNWWRNKDRKISAISWAGRHECWFDKDYVLDYVLEKDIQKVDNQSLYLFNSDDASI